MFVSYYDIGTWIRLIISGNEHFEGICGIEDWLEKLEERQEISVTLPNYQHHTDTSKPVGKIYVSNYDMGHALAMVHELEAYREIDHIENFMAALEQDQEKGVLFALYGEELGWLIDTENIYY